MSLVLNHETENLIEISWKFKELLVKHESLSDIDSLVWKREFCQWASDFEEENKGTDWNDTEARDYYEEIEKYAEEKILSYAREGGIDV